MKINIYVFFLFLSLSSCNSFSDFYVPLFDAKMDKNLITLKQGEEPKILYSDNIENDYLEILSNHYACIGYTSVNGPEQSQSEFVNKIKQQCLENKAILAIYNRNYTDTRNGTISIPGQQTTTHSGSIYGSGGYGSYTGTSRTTTMNNYNYSVRRYDYLVYYFVPINSKLKFGISHEDLNNESRQKYQRNTGAFVYVVYKNTPAFYANILRGDIIIRVNQYIINSANDLTNVLDKYKSGDTIEVELLRNNNKIIINVTLE